MMNQWGALVLFAVAMMSVAARNPAKRDTMESPNIPAVVSQLGLSKLLQLVVDAKLAKTLSEPGPFTVFGPTNEAFQNLPQAIKDYIKDTTNLAGVLTFHVLSGKVLSTNLTNELLVKTVNGKNLRVNVYLEKTPIVATAQCAPIDMYQVDQLASNGVVHVLDQVMLPPTGPLADAIQASSSFTTLTIAIKAAGLFDPLNGDGPFTVFAPTDEAFMNLPDGALDALLANVTELQNVLANHVVTGTFCKAGLTSGPVTTHNMEDVVINVSGAGEVTVGGFNVVNLDVPLSVSNGVVHPIDGVLLPSGH